MLQKALIVFSLVGLFFSGFLAAIASDLTHFAINLFSLALYYLSLALLLDMPSKR